MNRRTFFKIGSMAAVLAGLPRVNAMPNLLEKPRLIKPRRLQSGATVAVIAPSSPPREEKLIKGLENLRGFGFNLVEGKSLRAQNGHLAGTDAERLADLHWAFQDPAIDAIWCIRGGYGAGRLLPSVDYALIKQHPKPLIGYSDITALHVAIHQETGLVTFHGPVAAGEYPEDTTAWWKSVLMEPQLPLEIKANQAEVALLPVEFQPFTITPGTASGTLTGGNLALLAAMTGTPFAPVFRNKIVFLEDVGEQPYRIDRMLTQLLQGTDLMEAAGIALGVFNECLPKPGSFSLSLQDTLRDRLGNLGIPVAYGIPFGHVDHQATLPYGIKARLDADNQALTLLEQAVV
ncbi:MAG: LD-carboxypeptidase [Saprospiraceae bacterium]|nr:LD-carboxypeptidase [Saprospiraceae bacterium]